MLIAHNPVMPTLSRPTSAKALLTDGKPIAVIAPHPDDEVFGCGLLINAARSAGVAVVVIVLTDGQASHPHSAIWPPKRLAALRRHETRRGLRRLGAGAAPLRFIGWPDGALAARGRPRRLRQILVGLGVRTALVTSPRDFHADHRAAFAIALRAVTGTGIALATYEVWSRVDARVVRARTTGSWAKHWAARAHRSQLGNYIVDDPGAFAFDPHAFRALVDAEERYAHVAPCDGRVTRSRSSVRPLTST